MPMQTQQNASFAKRYGAQVAQANAEYKDKPVDLGMRRLPAGIKNAVAKLSAVYTKEQTEDGGMVPKGEVFFRASAVVMWPEAHNGEKVAQLTTSQVIPLCNVPAKGQRKGSTFGENYGKFQKLIRLLGIAPCPETLQTDPTGQKAEAYWFAAMRTLTDPARGPVYVSFSTRGWTPPATQEQPKPTEMVFEEWRGLASEEQIAKIGTFDPAAAVTVQPGPMTPPPVTTNGPIPTPAPSSARDIANQRAASAAAAESIANRQPAPTPATPTYVDPDEIAAMVEVAMGDPNGETSEGAEASARLEELAWQAGATKEQTAAAKDWAEVAEMALGVMPNTAPAQTDGPTTPAVGSRWLFAKRKVDGAKLKNTKGEEFPSQEVEVVTVDVAAKTCTVKDKSGKDVMDIRTKAPVVVKWEWLEVLAY